MVLRSIEEIDIEGRRVLLRVDFNVPIEDGHILDKERIQAAVPTIKNALNRNAHIIIISHLGRPTPQTLAQHSLKPVARELSNILRRPVIIAPDVVGPEVNKLVQRVGPSEILMLENLRFHPGELTNDTNFAKELASYAHVYINDAFGVCHRHHASISAVAQRFKDKGAGFLLLKEIDYLKNKLLKPHKPFVIVFGGAKVSEKIPPIYALLDRATQIVIGGAMAYTFLAAKGYQIGKSLVSPERIEECKAIIAKAQERNIEILLPIDHIAAKRLTKSSRPVHIDQIDLPDDLMGLDIGPKTIEKYKEAIAHAKTIIWNGPMGAFEHEAFSNGSKEIARAVASNKQLTIVGGGDTISALKAAGATRGLSHISTGGGAMLNFLAGKSMPGIDSLAI